MSCADAGRPETDACVSCPNRERCRGKKPLVTQETVLRLVREVVLEVLAERRAGRGSPPPG